MSGLLRVFPPGVGNYEMYTTFFTRHEGASKSRVEPWALGYIQGVPRSQDIPRNVVPEFEGAHISMYSMGVWVKPLTVADVEH